MLEYMLDTDICIYIMKRRPIDLADKFDALVDKLCISTISLAELHYGAEKSARRQENFGAIERFTARMVILPFSARDASHYAQIRAALERLGTPCGTHDMQIAGHARSQGLTVVTNNMREFSRMPGLRAENWV